jgi:hypothetical protein
MADEEDGTEEAKAVLEFINMLGTIGAGIEYASSPRKGKLSSKEILDIHGDKGVTSKQFGNVKRDIRATNKDAARMADVFAKRIEKHLSRIGKVTTEAASKQAIASALKAAADIYKKALYKNFENQTNADGSSLHKVTDEYAKKRKEKLFISEDVVMVATGQLGRGIANGKYNIFYESKTLRLIREK